mmetsp:Transcript_70072/g.85976  ORF Transcript_70072/g.85976 Transcript_70072/m.85976 type:complete len:536 (-) Transcript_70072:32-1639(-)
MIWSTVSKGFLPLLFTLAAAHNFLDSNEVTENEVQQSLMDNLDQDVEKGAKWAELHQALLPTYNALPKNSQGLIDHQAVRYVLHRMFVQKYGWYMKGLEPSGDHWHEETNQPDLGKVKEWVPTYLQDLLEKRLHHKGLDLKGLVQLALSLEELVSHEAKNRLKTAYDIHNFQTNGELTRSEADDLIRTWYVQFLLAGNFSAASPEEVHAKKAIFTRRYSDWQDADNWLGNLEKEHYQGLSAPPSFGANFDLVQKIGERYFHFNDGECRALKATMQDMEGKKAGRVRLSTFYKKSLYSHWRFTEKADYLRRLGALDDSDPQQPQVIMANYMMARPNCLEASGLYAICCRNECEDLMGQLETELKTSMAEPMRILQLVANMSSDTVAAPRSLSQALQTRLREVANLHGGKVPIHGRLFAQWMHHAFPNECPYPHIAEDQAVLVPDHWQNGKATVSTIERAELAEVHTPVLLVEDAQNLSWSEEELVVVKEQPKLASGKVRLLMQFALLLGLLHTILRSCKMMTFQEKGKAGRTELPF